MRLSDKPTYSEADWFEGRDTSVKSSMWDLVYKGLDYGLIDMFYSIQQHTDWHMIEEIIDEVNIHTKY